MAFRSPTFHAINASGLSIGRRLGSFTCSVARPSKVDTHTVRNTAGKHTQARQGASLVRAGNRLLYGEAANFPVFRGQRRAVRRVNIVWISDDVGRLNTRTSSRDISGLGI